MNNIFENIDTICFTGPRPAKLYGYTKKEEYQKIVDHKSLYSSVLQKIPAPYFIVFYNGTEKEEDRWENSLSEAYENLTGEPKLELKVITLNNCASHSRYFSDELDALSF